MCHFLLAPLPMSARWFPIFVGVLLLLYITSTSRLQALPLNRWIQDESSVITAMPAVKLQLTPFFNSDGESQHINIRMIVNNLDNSMRKHHAIFEHTLVRGPVRTLQYGAKSVTALGSFLASCACTRRTARMADYVNGTSNVIFSPVVLRAR
jgi:hypothetical protein